MTENSKQQESESEVIDTLCMHNEKAGSNQAMLCSESFLDFYQARIPCPRKAATYSGLVFLVTVGLMKIIPPGV